MHGEGIPAGPKLRVLIGSANRAAAVFTAPDTFSSHRDPRELSKSLIFGTGRHFCLGANLARLEARVVLAELVRRTCGFTVSTERAQPVHSTSVRGLASLPTTFIERTGDQ